MNLQYIKQLENERKSFKKFFKFIFFLLIWCCIVRVIIIYFFPPLPVVHWSTSKDQCEKVYIKNELYGCDILKQRKIKKYELIWVE